MVKRPCAKALVVFDFDGTLADSFDWFVRALNEIAPRYRSRPIAPSERDRLRELPARAVLRHLGGTWWKLPAVAQALRWSPRASRAWSRFCQLGAVAAGSR